MTRIRKRRGRHFIDENGRLFWINGPDDHCYLSEQRQWRRGLDFDQVLDWKQCAPSGLVSQRFSSLQEACEAYEHSRIVWYQDLYLRRMGDQMAAHRSLDDYKPTVMKQAEEAGAAFRVRWEELVRSRSGSSLAWAPGALDGVMGHHVAACCVVRVSCEWIGGCRDMATPGHVGVRECWSDVSNEQKRWLGRFRIPQSLNCSPRLSRVRAHTGMCEYV